MRITEKSYNWLCRTLTIAIIVFIAGMLMLVYVVLNSPESDAAQEDLNLAAGTTGTILAVAGLLVATGIWIMVGDDLVKYGKQKRDRR